MKEWRRTNRQEFLEDHNLNVSPSGICCSGCTCLDGIVRRHAGFLEFVKFSSQFLNKISFPKQENVQLCIFVSEKILSFEIWVFVCSYVCMFVCLTLGRNKLDHTET